MKRLLVAVVAVAALDAHADVTGALVTPDGKPVAGALVALHTATPYTERFQRFLDGKADEALASAQSDAKGNFKVEIATRGNYLLQIRAAGFVPTGVATTGEGDLGGILVRPAATKRGRVTANGKPLPGARLWFNAGNSDEFVQTGEDGSFTVADPDLWRPSIRVTHSNQTFYEQPARMGSTPLDIAMRKGVALRGRVLEADGKTGAKATLTIDGIARGTTNEDGSFAIADVPPTWRTLIATSGKRIATMEREGTTTLRLGPAQTVAGTILDAKSKLPVPGATLMLTRDRFGQISVFSAKTDAKGRFEFPSVPRGKITLVADHAGYEGVARPLESASVDARPIYLDPKAYVFGFVTNDRREPVAAAWISTMSRARQMSGGRQTIHVSAPDGRYVSPVDQWVLSLSDGTIDVIASRTGYAAAKDGPHAVKPGEKSRVDVVLTHGTAISGRVLLRDGEGLPGVRVAALELEGKNSRTYPWSVQWDDQPKTDAAGAFALQLRPALYDVYFHKPGFAPKKLAGVDLRGVPTPLEVSLDPAVAISGRVISATGEVQPDVEVNAHISDGPPIQTVTDQSGAFVLDGLAAGPVGVSFTTTDQRIEESRSLTAPAENVTIELLPTVSLSGRVVTADGDPVPVFTTAITDANSYGGRERTHSFEDPDGKFSISDVPVKPAALRVSAPGFATAQIALQLEKGKAVEQLEVKLAAAGTVTGVVRLRGSGPVGDVRLVVDGTQRPPVHASTDANGEYTLENVPLGAAEIIVHKIGYPQVRKNVDVERMTRLDIEIEKGKTLSGRVVTESGVPLQDVQISTRTSTAGGAFASTKSDATGRFVLEGLTSGLVEVRASFQGYVDGRLEAIDVDTAGELTLTLSKGATVTGRVIGIDVAKQREMTVGVVGDHGQVNTAVNPDGTWRIEGVEAGKVGIRAWATGESRRASELKLLETTPGSTYSVDLEFLEHNTIRGRVTRDGTLVTAGSVAFLRVNLDGRSAGYTRIAEDGTFEMKGIESGTYDLTVFTPGVQTRYTVRKDITTSQTIDIDMRPVSLTVLVVNDASDEPLAGAEVVLLTSGPVPSADMPRATTGSDGRALLQNLSPGEYDVRVALASFAAVTTRRTLSGGKELVEVRLTPSEGILLSVIDARNAKRVSAVVTARDQAGAIVYSGFPEQTPEGAMRVPLGPGTYRLNIFTRGLEMAYTTATSPGAHEVVLRPGGTLAFETANPTPVRVLASDGSIYNLDSGEITTIHVIIDGTFVTDMSVGTYTIQILDASGGVVRTERVEIRAGETTKLRL